MIQIETLEVSGLKTAHYAMRNPMNSWNDGDSGRHSIGDKDKRLSQKLIALGDEQGKHTRMILAYADIKAPLYWWREFDTYRQGVEKISCSTMHKLCTEPFTEKDFSERVSQWVVSGLENNRLEWLQEENPKIKREIWDYISQNLPRGYLQKATVMMSYQTLRRIYRQRKGHKLSEWQMFREWCETLPEPWLIMC